MSGHTLVRKPTILAIISSQSVLHDKRLSRIECLRIYLEAPLQIVWMHTFSPPLPHLLLQATPAKLEPGFVKERAEFVHARHPNKNGCCIGHDSETLLAFSQARRAGM